MSYTGSINGLLITSDYMNVLSNNIANASTIGFKSSTPSFYNIIPQPFYSCNTLGTGVGISRNVQNFKDGMFIETGRDLDLKITENGFFRVLDAHGHVYYTRNGEFLIDKDKNLINMQGMYLTGRNTSYSKNNLNDTYKLQPINLKRAYILKSKPTTTITLNAILNSNLDPVIGINNLTTKSDQSITYNTVIYNKDEKPENINIFFNKIDKNKWKVNVALNNANNLDIEPTIDHSSDLKFNADGQLTSEPMINLQLQNSKNKNITLNLSGTSEQSDSDNSWEEFSQNGYLKGSLKTFEILSNGEIVGTYSNEQVQVIGQIILSTFVNPERLQPENGNTWSATAESGKEKIGIAGDLGFGILSTKTLEASNVDLNKELINMITAQRNYQSNAQAFKTEDKLINTLINLR